MKSVNEGVAKLVDVEEQLATWRDMITASWRLIKLECPAAGSDLLDELEYVLHYNPEEQVQQLQLDYNLRLVATNRMAEWCYDHLTAEQYNELTKVYDAALKVRGE